MKEIAMEHLELKAKTRRIILQEDTNMPINLLDRPDIGMDEFIEHRFRLIRQTQVDTIIWDMGLEQDAYRVYMRGELSPFRDRPKLHEWAEQGRDLLDECIRAARAHGIESFWNHRISEIDSEHPYQDGYMSIPWDSPRRENRLKKMHPDWLVKTWWPQGNWNLAHPEVRRHKVSVLRELFLNYELDGLQIDFARHTPFLPPGQEWEHHDAVTEFMVQVRNMLSEVESLRKRPILLTAKIGETLEGNKFDGLDIATWMEEELVDVLVLGGRATTIDFTAFEDAAKSTSVKLWPQLDGHHTPEGYHYPPEEYLRGIFYDWRLHGADAIALFNWIWPNEQNETPHRPNVAMLHEAGDFEVLKGKPIMFAAEARGEYPWAGNYIYRSDDKPLPATASRGAGAIIPIEADDLPQLDRLMAMIEGMAENSIPEVSLNGNLLKLESFDPYRPDYGHGFGRHEQKRCLPAAFFHILPQQIKRGGNLVSLFFPLSCKPRLYTIIRLEISSASKRPIWHNQCSNHV